MTLNSDMLNLPGTHVGIVRDTALDAGVLGRLAPEKPTLFGSVSGATFSGVPRAEIVGESEAKSAQDPFTITPWSADPVKFHIGIRTSNEFMWGTEDYQLGILQDLVAPAFGAGIGRAADLFTFHGINPATGAVSPKATKYLAQTSNVVTAAGAPTNELNAAVGLVAAASALPNGIAMDARYNYALTTEVYPEGSPRAGDPVYPQLGFSGVQSWRGLNLATSTTVAGVPELATDSGVRAFVGDYGQVRWGFQRNFPLELIEYGDPDNTGRDLKGHNEVFIRTEAVLYVAIGDLAKFAQVREADTEG